MAFPAPGFVALGTTDLNGGSFSRGWFPINESLVPRGQIAALHTDGVELVDLFRNGQELGDWAKRFSPEIHVGPGHDDADASVCQGVGHLHHPHVQKLGLIDGHDVHLWANSLGDLHGGGDGDGLGLVPVMGADGEDASVAVIQMGLEDLDLALGDEGPTNPAEKLLGLSAEHHPRDDLDPTVLRAVVHEWAGLFPHEDDEGNGAGDQ